MHECPGELWSGFRGQPVIQWLRRGPREDRDLNWRRWGGGAQGSQESNQTRLQMDDREDTRRANRGVPRAASQGASRSGPSSPET